MALRHSHQQNDTRGSSFRLWLGFATFLPLVAACGSKSQDTLVGKKVDLNTIVETNSDEANSTSNDLTSTAAATNQSSSISQQPHTANLSGLTPPTSETAARQSYYPPTRSVVAPPRRLPPAGPRRVSRPPPSASVSAEPRSARSIDSRSADGEATVRAFYGALGTGNGVAASSQVIPEKRSSGAFSPEAISRFYGNLSDPLRLTSITPPFEWRISRDLSLLRPSGAVQWQRYREARKSSRAESYPLD